MKRLALSNHQADYFLPQDLDPKQVYLHDIYKKVQPTGKTGRGDYVEVKLLNHQGLVESGEIPMATKKILMVPAKSLQPTDPSQKQSGKGKPYDYF